MFIRQSQSGRPTNSWSYLHANYRVKREHRIFQKIGWLCWTSWWMMGGHLTGQICWLFSWKAMWLMSGIHPKMSKWYFTCPCLYLMQSVPNINFLTWVGHGHWKRLPSTFIACFFLAIATEELWQGWLAIASPRCASWSLSRIHLACPKKWWRQYLTLQIGMPHPRAPSLGCLAERSLCMFYQGMPQKIWSCKRSHITSPQDYQ